MLIPDPDIAMPRTLAERTIKCTCLMFGVKMRELRGPSRLPFFVDARQYAARRLRAQGLSFTAIGRQINRDRTTVYHLLYGRRRR